MNAEAEELHDRSGELVVDYRNYDFRSVWAGRQEVDEYDQALLRLAVSDLDQRRILEIGTGFGRLTPPLIQAHGEYAGVDFDMGGLREARASIAQSGRANPRSIWLGANAYHLPFAAKSFSSVCMVRVHHHLADPVRALQEVTRVLVPGGTALITYSARSGFGSLIHDARVLLGRPKVRNDRYLLFARGGHIQVRQNPLRQFITAPHRFVEDLRQAGLSVERWYGGPETTAARILPLRVGLAFGRRWPSAPFFSTHWVVARRPGAPGDLPLWENILICPECGAPGPRLDAGTVRSRPCSNCGFPFRDEGDLVDARFVSHGVSPRSGAVTPSPAVAALPFAAVSSRFHGPRPGSRVSRPVR
jgi:SAM-dependent methyltransferase